MSSEAALLMLLADLRAQIAVQAEEIARLRAGSTEESPA